MGTELAYEYRPSTCPQAGRLLASFFFLLQLRTRPSSESVGPPGIAQEVILASLYSDYDNDNNTSIYSLLLCGGLRVGLLTSARAKST